MGCYDTIYFKCPNCGEEIEAQTKSGPCCFGEYELEDVPEEVAWDANRHAPHLCNCGAEWGFYALDPYEGLLIEEYEIERCKCEELEDKYDEEN